MSQNKNLPRKIMAALAMALVFIFGLTIYHQGTGKNNEEQRNADLTLTYVFSEEIDTAYIKYKDFVICKDSPNTVLCNLNLSVHTSLKYGNGPDIELTPENLVNFGEGNCGHFSHLLRLELAKQNYTSETISIFSTLGAVHALIEVKTSTGNYVLDPTLGIFYRHDFLSLVGTPLKAYDFVGRYPSLMGRYGGIELFSGIEYFLFMNDTSYEFEDVDLIGNFVAKSRQITVSTEGIDYLNVSFSRPLNFYVESDFKVSRVFEPGLGAIGFNVPVYGRKSITLQFDRNISKSPKDGTLRLTGKKIKRSQKRSDHAICRG